MARPRGGWGLGLLGLSALLVVAGCVPDPSGSPPDRTPPAVTLTLPGNGATTPDPTPDLKGKAGTAKGDVVVVTVRIYAGTSASGTPLQVISVSRSGANWATIANELPDGVYTARAAQSDAAGNVGRSAPRTFTVARAPSPPPPPPDTTPPATPSIPDLHPSSDTGASQSDDLTNDTTPRFTGNTERGATVTILSDGGAVGTDIANGSGRYDVTVSVLTPGSHTIRARATDANSNPSPLSGSRSITIDTTPPAPPSTPDLTDASDTGASNSDDVTDDTTPTFTGTAAAGSTVRILDGATQVGSGTATGGNYSITTSALANGPHTITATATDPAGNTSAPSGSLLVTIGTAPPGDTTPPDPPSTPDLDAASDTGSSSTDDLTSDTTPTFTGTAEAGSTVRLFEGSTELGNAVATGGSYSITTSTLGGGPHTITATATDAALNTSAPSAGITLTVDTAAPAAPSTPDLDAASDTGTSSTDDLTTDATPTFSGTAEADTLVRLFDGSTELGSGLATGGAYSITTSTLADDDYSITATAEDTAGNVSLASAALAVTIDANAPAAPSTPDLAATSDTGSSSTDDITSDTTPTFTGTAEAGSVVRLFDGSTEVGSGTATGGNYSIAVSVLSENGHTITATATDALNTSPSSAGLSITIDATPPAAPSTPDLDAASDTGTSSTDDVTSDTTPTFSGTAEAGSLVRLFDGSTEVGSGTATGGNYSITVPALTDDDYSITATAEDTAGNVSVSSGVLAVTIDANAPAAPSTPDLDAASDTGTSSTDDVTSDTTPTFSGTAAAGSLVRLFDGSTEVGSGTATGGNYSITVLALTDDDYSITATAEDTAGNVSVSSGALAVTIDTGAPAAPSTPDLGPLSDSGTSSTDDLTNVTTPTFTGTAEAGATVRLFEGSTELGNGVATGGNYSIISSTLGGGPHTVTATAEDTAGNVSAPSSGITITVDAATPAAPSTPDLDTLSDSGTSNTDDVTSDTTPTFTGTAEADATVRLFDGSTELGSGPATGGNYSITVSALADDDYSITATAEDTAGNVSVPSGALAVTIDTGAPAAPSTPDLDAASDTGTSSTDDVTSDTTPTFSGTAEAGSLVRVFDGASQVGSGVAAGGNYSVTVSTLTGGPHTIRAAAEDAAGNLSTVSSDLSITIDATAPAAPSTPNMTDASDTGASNTDNVTSNATPTFTGTAEDGTLVRLFEGSTELGSGPATGGNYSITVSALAGGPHTITATATDAAGNGSAASSGLTITVDTGVPPAPSTPNMTDASDTGASNNDNVTSNATPTFTGTAESGATVTLFDGATPVGSGVAAGGNYSIVSSTLADGPHTITATATDTAGNPSVASGGLSVTVDTVVPGVPSVPDLDAASDLGTSSTDNLTADNTPTFTGTADVGVTVRLLEGITQVGTGTATGGNYSITTSTLTNAPHSITATATDLAGNASAASSGLTVTINTTAPAVPGTPDLQAGSDLGGSSTDDNTSDTTPTFTVSATNGVTVTIRDGATPVGSAVASGGSATITTSTLTNGTHSITAVATSTAGANSAASSALSVVIDTVAPTPTSVTLANAGTLGTVASDDSVSIVFSEALRLSSLCSAWTVDGSDVAITANGAVVVTITDSGTNDVLTVTTATGCTGGFNLSSIALGGNYVSTTRTFSGTGSNTSDLTWTASTRTLKIELGTASGPGNTGIAAGTPVYTPSTAIQDPAGNAMAATPFNGTSSRF